LQPTGGNQEVTMPRKKTSSRTKGRRVRYAVVGQGYIAQVAVLPAFAHARRNSELVALFSDDPQKLRRLGRKYRIDELYGYDDYERGLQEAEVDAVYIALPNDMHREYTERAAKAGVHVLCEKPMAPTVKDCEAMIEAARANRVRLMIAYRLHFQKGNLEVVKAVESGRLGQPRFFSSVFSMQVKDEDNIRLKNEKGGGTLWDIGIYCINAARYLFREEPEEVFAMTANNGERRFREVEEMTSAVLRFPGERLASFTCSFGAADTATYRLVGTEGDLRLDSAYEYAEGMKMAMTVKGRKQQRTFPKQDQFAPELLHFSDCVLTGKDPAPSGREGLADVRIIEALYESARKKRPVSLADFDPGSRPEPAQQLHRPPIRKPELVNAGPPSGKS
jgi:glucose-fructose oxidoreductase